MTVYLPIALGVFNELKAFRTQHFSLENEINNKLYEGLLIVRKLLISNYTAISVHSFNITSRGADGYIIVSK